MKLILLCLCVFLTSCSRHNPAPVYDAKGHYKKPPKVKKKSRNSDYVIVEKGDSLYSIGFSNNIDYKSLASINGIRSPYRIYPGQKLKLKKSKSTNKKSTVKTRPLIADKPIIQKPSKSNSSTAKKPSAKKPVKKPVNKIVKQPVRKPVINQPTLVSNQRWIWPIKGKIISSFSQTDVSRKGINISSPIGKPVLASNNGTVVYSGDGLRGYGELIILKHANNLLSAYAHNSRRLVKEGDTVKQGQQIAHSGKGIDGKGLLHFEIRKNGQPVNPVKYLPNR
jgi:lipoprotein NlpD